MGIKYFRMKFHRVLAVEILVRKFEIEIAALTDLFALGKSNNSSNKPYTKCNGGG